MRVIGTVGLPGSGKGEAAAVAEEFGVPVVSMGDAVRRATEERGRDPTTDHGAVAQALREAEGEDAIAARTLPIVREHLEDGAETVLIDGIRSDVEVAVFEDAFGEEFVLVSVEAPFEVRAERLDERGRDASAEEGGEGLAERDERELGFGMGAAMDAADVTIENTESLAAFRERVAAVIESGPDAVPAGGEVDGEADGEADANEGAAEDVEEVEEEDAEGEAEGEAS